MKKNGMVTKKLTAFMMSLAMVAHIVGSPVMSKVAKAAEPASSPSVTAYATPDDLKDADNFTLYTGNGSGVCQKVYFGDGKTWYIAGAEGNQLVLLADPNSTNPFNTMAFAGSTSERTYDGSSDWGVYETDLTVTDSVYANHYGSSDLRAYLNSSALSTFTAKEQSIMVAPKVFTMDTKNDKVYSTQDKLYLPYGDSENSDYRFLVKVGTNSEGNLYDGITVGILSTTGMGETPNAPQGSPFAQPDVNYYIRAPYPYASEVDKRSHVQNVEGNYFVNDYWSVTEGSYISTLPVCNIDMSSVIFASAATSASASATIESAMTFRFDGEGVVKSTAVYDEDGIKVTKADDNEFLYIQYKDGTGDKIYVSAITDDMVVSTSDIGIDNLNNCKIWVEKKEIAENITYAVMATKADGHSFVDDPDAGKHKCDICGLLENHIFTDYTYNNDATYTADGTETGTCACGKKDTRVKAGTKLALIDYKIKKGSNSEWTTGSTDGLNIVSEADFSKFVCIKVDDEIVASENYTAVSGSTDVTLKATYLATLSIGKHTFEITSNDGSAKTSFTIVKAPDNPTPDEPKPENPKPNSNGPKTGDPFDARVWMLLALSGMGLVGLGIKRKKR